MLPLLRLALARWLCPPTHRVEPRDPGSLFDRVCRTTSAAERDRQHEAEISAFERSLMVESWNGRAR